MKKEMVSSLNEFGIIVLFHFHCRRTRTLGTIVTHNVRELIPRSDHPCQYKHVLLPEQKVPYLLEDVGMLLISHLIILQLHGYLQ